MQQTMLSRKDNLISSLLPIATQSINISEDEYNELSPEVYRYDPKISLTLGGDGLNAYRIITSQARDKLSKNGRVFLEIGYKQAPAVKYLLEKAGFDEIRIHKDLNSKDRVLSATVS